MDIKFDLDSRPYEHVSSNLEFNFSEGNGVNEEVESTIVSAELKKTKKILNEHKEVFRKIMHMSSHKVRQPLANILALSNLLDHHKNSPTEIKKIFVYLKLSLLTLDTYTRELTTFISGLTQQDKE